MRVTAKRFDPVGLVFWVLALLLAVGVLPFSPFVVGALLILAKIEVWFEL